MPIEHTYGRALLDGILRAARRFPGLRVRLARNVSERSAALMGKETYVAAIGLIWSRAEVDELHKRCGTVISFANQPPYPADRHILLDDRAIGRLAALEFRAMGIEHFGILQPENHHYMVERVAGFLEAATDVKEPPPLIFPTSEAASSWLQAGTAAPKAIFAVNDFHARILLNLCEAHATEIPAQASVIGVDDDEIYVHLGELRLSSVALPFVQMGERAVESVLCPAHNSPELIQFAPHGITHRDTTSGFHSYPPIVRRYIQFLQRTSPLPPSVDVACRQCGVPRRSLELSTRAALGRTPLSLLNDCRQRQLSHLRANGLSRHQIAHLLGFSSSRSLKQFPPNKRTANAQSIPSLADLD
jgi:AraC-like DNA-binding protein